MAILRKNEVAIVGREIKLSEKLYSHFIIHIVHHFHMGEMFQN